MDDVLKAYLGQIKGLDEIVELQRRWQEQMRAATAPLLEYRKEIESWVLPYRRLQEDMQKWAEPYRLVRDEIRKWIEPQQKLQEQMQRLMEPYRQLQEQAQKLIEPYQYWQREAQKLLTSASLQEYLKEVVRLRDSMLKSEININDLLGGIDEERLWVDEAGTIVVGDAAVSAEEFTSTFSVFFEALGKIPSPAEVVAFIVDYIGRLSKPLSTILLIIVLPYIINVSSNLTTPYFEELLGQVTNRPKREQIKSIKSEASKRFDTSLLREYRFVSTEVLHVRSDESTKAKIIADIGFGQVVRVLKKGRSWSFVECADRDAEQPVQGWVFSRYLRKFEE